MPDYPNPPARKVIWRLEQYAGEAEIAAAPTQLVTNHGVTQKAQAALLTGWIGFFAAGPSPILRLELSSRVSQALLASLTGQTQLESLSLKWGPYSDLAPLAALRHLNTLILNGAKQVVDVSPLGVLHELTTLQIDEAHSVTDFAPLGALTGLRSLSLGNAHPGSDRILRIENVEWMRSLRELTTLSLPGTRLEPASFEVFGDLPHLEHLRVPLRRSYRARVFALASDHAAFAEVAESYIALDGFRRTLRRA
ncbi:MAG: hypothetical protein JWN36_1670 [Microbacteriaceae bacterium]|nr:hypothetical protein [Microbacteriaceae bacterium]